MYKYGYGYSVPLATLLNQAVTIPFDGVITNLFAEHAADKLIIPTPATNAEGGCTHPDVIDFNLINGGMWNGYRYWMGFTPLPTTLPDPNENPCIVASNDKITWVVPAGGSNPITPTPPVSYNSDTTLHFENNTLYLIYRTWTGSPNKSWVAFKTSTDGITWSAQQYAYNTALGNNEIVSPSIIKKESTYYMYGIDGLSATVYTKILYRYSSGNLTGFTSTRELCSIDVTNTVLGENAATKWYPWHLNVKYINGYYLAIIYFRSNDGILYGDETIYLATSTDGLNFTLSKYPLFAKYATGAGKWDVGFYRCAIVPKMIDDKVGFDLWYPGWANNHEVFPTFIGYTEIKPIESTINHIYGGNTLKAARVSELALATSKTGYTFGDDVNRANGAINPPACTTPEYTITHGVPTIQSGFIAPSTAATTRFTLPVPASYDLSFDAVNADGVSSTDGGFRIHLKAKTTSKWIGIYDGIYKTKVLYRVSGTTVEIDRRHNIFLKTDLNNFRIVFNGTNLKYYINGCIVFDKTFTVADFVDQADMDDIMAQTTLVFQWTAVYTAKIKNITIKQL